MDYIVTSNIKDFAKSDADKVITPEECLEVLNNQH